MAKEIRLKHRIRIGEELLSKREEQGWSIEQVAKMADVKPATVVKIEAGVFNVPLDVLAKVADVLGCEINIKAKIKSYGKEEN